MNSLVLGTMSRANGTKSAVSFRDGKNGNNKHPASRSDAHEVDDLLAESLIFRPPVPILEVPPLLLKDISPTAAHIITLNAPFEIGNRLSVPREVGSRFPVIDQLIENFPSLSPIVTIRSPTKGIDSVDVASHDESNGAVSNNVQHTASSSSSSSPSRHREVENTLLRESLVQETQYIMGMLDTEQVCSCIIYIPSKKLLPSAVILYIHSTSFFFFILSNR